jgi:hypothetical protein
MALLTTQIPTPTGGLVPAYGAANATDTFTPDGDTFIYVKNTNAATRTITVGPATTKTFRGLTVTLPAPTVAATTGELIMGPFPPDMFADPTTGVCTITPSATAGVTLAVVRVAVTQ